MSRYGPNTYEGADRYPWRNPQHNLSELYPVSISNDWFQNDYGMYRWHLIRIAYEDGVIDEDYVTDLFRDWRDTPEFFGLEGRDIDDFPTGDYAFVKASKRGNDLYKDRVKRKFDFFDKLPNREFFKDWGRKTTPMLFVTLTVDPKRYTLQEAWFHISHEFNRFETLLRQKYGYFVKLRVWEVHKSGYPHVHVVYYFNRHDFEVWEDLVYPEDGSDPKLYHRVHKSVEGSIRNMWSMGTNINIQGVQDTLGALSEVKKYVTKNIWSKKADKTNAMLTLFRKQSYYISLKDPYNQPHPKDIADIDDFFERDKATHMYLGAMVNVWASQDFIGSVWGVDWYLWLYDELHAKNETLAEPGLNSLVSETLHSYNIDRPEIHRWVFMGFILGADLHSIYPKFEDDWAFVVKDPPSELFACINFPEVY